jgi:hypothetical protein
MTTVFQITVERISTGEVGSGGIVRCETAAQAIEYAEAGICQSPTPDDLRVVEVKPRGRN